jgi:hypothetical protein
MPQSCRTVIGALNPFFNATGDTMSIKEKIRNRTKVVVTEKVDTPEWPEVDGTVFVRKVSSKERDDWEAGIVGDGKKRDLKNLRARFVVYCACDEIGGLLFDQKDAGWLGDDDASVIDRLWDKGRKLSGISDEDNEELVKNSSETTDDDSHTS